MIGSISSSEGLRGHRSTRRGSSVSHFVADNMLHMVWIQTAKKRKPNKTEKRRKSVMAGQKGRKAQQGGKQLPHSVRSRRPFNLTISMGVDSDLNPHPKLARVPSMTIHRTHDIPVRESAATRQLPSASSVERADVPSGNGVARQRALVGNSFDDKQWSDNLPDPWSR